MTEQKKRTRLSRGATRTLKANKIVEALPQKVAVPESEERSEPLQGQRTIVATVTEPEPAAVLKHEIQVLRKQLAEKTAAYRSLAGQNLKGETKTVTHLLSLLGRPEGATKATLVSETGAKKGYIDALLSRILPSRGYVIDSFSTEGARTKSYRVSSDQKL
jgi:hypothetical protein